MMEVRLIDSMGTDLTVVNAARVSFGKKTEVFREEDRKLIAYLAKHQHLSPFGHCFASFHVKAPIFVSRQLVKHEYLRINEISRRYVDSEPEFYTPEVWRGRPDGSIKQGSEGTADVDTGQYNRHCYSGLDIYDQMIHDGVAPEQARMVLPQSMYTEWYWSGSLDAFAKMYKLRIHHSAQEETQQIAKKIGANMELLYPVSWRELTR